MFFLPGPVGLLRCPKGAQTVHIVESRQTGQKQLLTMEGLVPVEVDNGILTFSLSFGQCSLQAVPDGIIVEHEAGLLAILHSGQLIAAEGVLQYK